jgi:hypothetical protein
VRARVPIYRFQAKRIETRTTCKWIARPFRPRILGWFLGGLEGRYRGGSEARLNKTRPGMTGILLSGWSCQSFPGLCLLPSQQLDFLRQHLVVFVIRIHSNCRGPSTWKAWKFSSLCSIPPLDVAKHDVLLVAASRSSVASQLRVRVRVCRSRVCGVCPALGSDHCDSVACLCYSLLRN